LLDNAALFLPIGQLHALTFTARDHAAVAPIPHARWQGIQTLLALEPTEVDALHGREAISRATASTAITTARSEVGGSSNLHRAHGNVKVSIHGVRNAPNVTIALRQNVFWYLIECTAGSVGQIAAGNIGVTVPFFIREQGLGRVTDAPIDSTVVVLRLRLSSLQVREDSAVRKHPIISCIRVDGTE